MAGKYFPIAGTRSPSFSLILFSLLALLSFLLSFSSPQCTTSSPNSRNPNRNSPPPGYSFVASLEKLLTSRSRSPPFFSSSGGPDSAEALDRSISKREEEEEEKKDRFDISSHG